MGKRGFVVEGGEFVDMDDARYTFRIGQLDIKDGTADDQYVVPLTCIGGPYDGNTIRDWISFSVGWKLSELFRAAGLKAGAGIDDLYDIAGEIGPITTGKIITAEIYHEEWNGETKMKVRAYQKSFKPSPGGDEPVKPGGGKKAAAPKSAEGDVPEADDDW